MTNTNATPAPVGTLALERIEAQAGLGGRDAAAALADLRALMAERDRLRAALDDAKAVCALVLATLPEAHHTEPAFALRHCAAHVLGVRGTGAFMGRARAALANREGVKP